MQHVPFTDDLLSLFEELDPSGIAMPEGFEAPAIHANFQQFVQSLKGLWPDLNIHISLLQDSTSFASITLPSSLFPGSRHGGSLILSCFGGLLWLQEPGINMQRDAKSALAENARLHGYRIVDPAVDEAPYTGIHRGFQTWGDRFFGYM